MHQLLAIPSTGHETTFTLPDNAVNIRLLYTSGKGAELPLDELRLGHNGISAIVTIRDSLAKIQDHPINRIAELLPVKKAK